MLFSLNKTFPLSPPPLQLQIPYEFHGLEHPLWWKPCNIDFLSGLFQRNAVVGPQHMLLHKMLVTAILVPFSSFKINLIFLRI